MPEVRPYIPTSETYPMIIRSAKGFIEQCAQFGATDLDQVATLCRDLGRKLTEEYIRLFPLLNLPKYDSRLLGVMSEVIYTYLNDQDLLNECLQLPQYPERELDIARASQFARDVMAATDGLRQRGNSFSEVIEYVAWLQGTIVFMEKCRVRDASIREFLPGSQTEAESG